MSTPYVPGQVLTAAELNGSLDALVPSDNAAITGGTIEGITLLEVVGTTASTSPVTGAATVAGGLGVGGAVNVGGTLSAAGQVTATSTQDTTSPTTGALVVSGGAYVAKTLAVAGSANVTGTVTGANVAASGTTDSTSTTTGALQTAGGIGVAKSMYVGANVNVGAGNITLAGSTGNIGASGTITAADVTLKPSGILTFGDGSTQSTAGAVNGEFAISTTGGTTTVSAANAAPNNIFKVTGALTSNAVIAFQALPKTFAVQNLTTGAYTLTVIATGQTPSVLVSQGAASSIFTDTTGAYAASASLNAANPQLLYNSSAEFGSAGWTLNANFSPLVDSAGGIGTYFGNPAAITSAITYSSSSPQVAIGAGNSITCAVDIANQATAGSITFSLAAFNSSGSLISNIGTQTIAAGTSLTRYTISGTTPASTAYVVFYMNFTGTIAPAYGIFWRRIKIELGLSASPYSQEADFPKLLTSANPVITSGGLTFADGSVQSTANGVTAPTSTMYSVALGNVTAGATSIVTSGYVSPFVNIWLNNARATPGVDWTYAGDNKTINLTNAIAANDQFEIQTGVIISPSTIFAQSVAYFTPATGATSISTTYTVGFEKVFGNGAKWIRGVDYTATDGATIVFLNGYTADGSTMFEVDADTPFTPANALPSTNPVITGGSITFPDGRKQGSAAGRQLLATVTVSGSNAQFLNLFSSLYLDYEIEFDDVVHQTTVANNSDQMWIQFAQSSTWNTTTGAYIYAWSFVNTAATSTPSGNTGGAAIVAYNGQSGAAPLGACGTIRIRNPLGTTGYKKVITDCAGQNAATGMTRYYGAGAFVANATACNGVQCVAGQSTFVSGTFRLYGIIQ